MHGNVCRNNGRMEMTDGRRRLEMTDRRLTASYPSLRAPTQATTSVLN